MDSSIMDLHATEFKAQSSNSTNSTSAAAERRGKKPFIRETPFLDKARVELQKMGRYTKDPLQMQKQAFFGTVTEASKGFNFNMHELKETSSLMVNALVRESSDECYNTSNPSAKNKSSLIGVRRQKNGKYGAVVTDTIRHKQVWLGTFDTIEEASYAYLSKKSEFEKLSQQGYVEVHKNKTSGNYTSEIRNPTSKKRIWLWTFGTAEEASQASQSNMLEFQKLVKEKQQQCTNTQTHYKQDAGKEKLVYVKQGHENVNCEPFQSESAGGSEITVPILNPSDRGTDRRIDSHEIRTAEEAFNAYQSKIFDFQSSKKVELQSNMPTDYSAGEKQEGQEDEDLWMGEWVQLPGNREVKFSLKLGLPIIDNYGSLLGEFSTLDDLNIC